MLDIFETREWRPATYPGSKDGRLGELHLEVRPPDLESDAFQGCILARFHDAVASASGDGSLETLARAEHSPESVAEVAEFLAGRVRAADGRRISATMLKQLAGTEEGSPEFWSWLQDQVFGSFLRRVDGEALKKKRPRLSPALMRIRLLLIVAARTVAASPTSRSTQEIKPTESPSEILPADESVTADVPKESLADIETTAPAP